MVPQQPIPTLTPIRGGLGWRVPALAVGVALMVLVGLTRLGGSERPTPTVAPSAVAVAPTRTPPAAPTPASTGVIQPAGGMRVSADGLTYADGIPTAIDGESVYRVRDALSYSEGRTLLVGGWYRDRGYLVRECAARPDDACASATISDVPLVGQYVGDVLTSFVALDGYLADTGAYIILATIETDPRCSIRAAGTCQPRLRVLQADLIGRAVVLGE